MRPGQTEPMRRLLLLTVLLALGCAAGAQARVGPGVLLTLEASQCTSNFVFRDATDLYLGLSAHCFGEGNGDTGVSESQPCDNEMPELGEPVTIEGARRPGTLAYSSFRTMVLVGETDLETCMSNDFAILRIHPDDHAAVDPSMPVFGGPVGLRRGWVGENESMLSFGRSPLRADAEPLKPREGYLGNNSQRGWMHNVNFLNQPLFGDSGSGVLDGAGGAVGALSRAGGGVTDLALALDYMRAHGGPDAHLVDGTAPFAGGALPVLVPSPPSPPDPAPVPSAAPAPGPAAAPPPAAAPAKAKAKAKKRRSCRRLKTRKARRRCAKRRG